MGHRDRTFVSYAREDIASYWAMRTWRDELGIAFDFHDAHDLSMAKGTAPDRRAIRARVLAAQHIVVLIGSGSRSIAERPGGFFAQELDVVRATRRLVILAHLNGSRRSEPLRLPVALQGCISVSVPWEPRILRHALDDFVPGTYPPTGTFFYPPEVYGELGL